MPSGRAKAVPASRRAPGPPDPSGALFDLVRLKSPSDQIVEQVRLLIAQGRLQPGQQLPTERDMAGLLGVGRQAVRGALSKLARAGLVDVVPFKGAFIRSLTPEALREPLLTLMESEISNMFEFMEVRQALETWSAEEAARRGDATRLKRIEDSLTTMEEAIREGRSISKADIEFHTAIAEASENVVLVHLMGTFTSLLHSTERFRNIAADAENTPTYLAQHRGIYEAIKAGDAAEARGRMRGHLRTVTTRVKDVLGKAGAQARVADHVARARPAAGPARSQRRKV
jgi:GntR family transcriptional repressor for pyruvate dehydrogenase complex